MFDRILLPIDGSELSEAAVEHAAALGEKFEATVIVLQVIDSEAQIIAHTAPATIEPLPSGQITAQIAHEAVEGQREKARGNLDRVAAGLRERGIATETSIVEGGPGDAICAAVEALECDTVVMATHGRSGFKRAVLGSVADHVVRNTPTASVLLIRPVEDRG
jgi:nucleotide-binding universal stress UspA family protein